MVDLLDEMLARYVDWREDADAAAAAYRRWCNAPTDEQAPRFYTYRNALVQEEASASVYALAVRKLECPAGSATTSE